MAGATPFDVVDASLEQIQVALASGEVTSVELVAEYLRRISNYDCRGLSLNSIPLINPDVFKEATESDDRRAGGSVRGPMDGIPYTVKDSFKVKGMTVASGAPAFQNLIANEDAFTVQLLRQAGAVLVGKTNMPPMAAGGMQRGVYGRAESPYNSDYLAAAFASGSSNGSGVSTSASFAAFGLGEETVSSGRSPASNNSLVAYTPSRGYLSIRGNWPLYPTCDVVVPHTRTMGDMFGLLDVISQPDSITRGDFWRHQSFSPLPRPWADRPKSFYDLQDEPRIQKTRIAVPQMFIETGQDLENDGVYVTEEVRKLWQQAKQDLESLGAEVVLVSEFPLITQYEAHTMLNAADTAGLPKDWKLTERGALVAWTWEEFLKDNNDPNLKTLYGVDPTLIWPFTDPQSPQMRFSLPENAIHWPRLSAYIKDGAAQSPPVTSQYETQDLEQAVVALEKMRKTLLEDWMADNKFDFVVFPANGDVGRADADVDDASAKHAWTNGVKYSNGNQALRHLGVPSVTVPMGIIEDKKMPVGLTFIGKAYDDVNILRLSYQYEQASKRRVAPFLTPSLSPSLLVARDERRPQARPHLDVEECTVQDDESLRASGRVRVAVGGAVKVHEAADNLPGGQPIVDIFVDGQKVSEDNVIVEKRESHSSAEVNYTFRCTLAVPSVPQRSDKDKVEAKIARDMIMVMIVARSVKHGKPTGWVTLLD